MRKAILATLLLLPLFSFAQDRSYHYGLIALTANVQKDTTVLIEEKQVYLFSGTYHQGERVIPHKAVDAITDISVIDADTNTPLMYSSKTLDKNDPQSWGKYAVYVQGGQTYIDWYFDLANTKNPAMHAWIIRYTVHGALAFYKDHDELYWNLFTDYSVPVERVEATIHLPADITSPSSSFYTSSNHQFSETRPDARTFHFTTAQIAPKEAVTFAVGWEKGIVDQGAYWRDFLTIYWPIIGAAVVLILSIIASITAWLILERRNRGRGTIIPQYEPPRNLRPAMADLIVRGHISKKAWAATVVDLAVRGFVQIKEDESKSFLSFLSFGRKDYIVEKKDVPTIGLEEYEKEFLEAIFDEETVFSTKELRRSQSKARRLFMSLREVEKDLDIETAGDTKAYIVPPQTLISWRIVLVAIIGAIVATTALSGSAGYSMYIFLGSLFVGAFTIYYTVKIKSRLNREGHILREEWLGFKMYLETAEKYRMQNLTPEIFEKYLPYAIIFGVEKKWAKAFEGMSLPPPSWYSGAYVAGVSGGTTPSFSASSFAGSFSASFSSAFSSAGGGGASGGGGGAGGGGGGGGGGAS